MWNSPADALASAANYLKQSGWRSGESWGEEVQLPQGFAYEQAEAGLRKPVAEWAQLGVRNAAGQPLPDSADEAAILLPAGYRGPAFLVRNNFNVILRYNAATAYALAIGVLSDRLRGAGIIQANWPVDEAPLETSRTTACRKVSRLLASRRGARTACSCASRSRRSAIIRNHAACRRTASPRPVFSPGFSTRAARNRRQINKTAKI